EVEHLLCTEAVEDGFHAKALHRSAQLHHRVGEEPGARVRKRQALRTDDAVEGFVGQVETGRQIVGKDHVELCAGRVAQRGFGQHPCLGQVVGGDAGKQVNLVVHVRENVSFSQRLNRMTSRLLRWANCRSVFSARARRASFCSSSVSRACCSWIRVCRVSARAVRVSASALSVAAKSLRACSSKAWYSASSARKS